MRRGRDDGLMDLLPPEFIKRRASLVRWRGFAGLALLLYATFSLSFCLFYRGELVRMGQETALLLERQERQRARAEQIGRLWAVHQFMQSDAPVCEVLKLLESSVSEETFVERLFVNDREIMFSGVSYETTFVSDFWGRMAHNMDASFRGRGAYLAEVPEISQEKRGHARAVTFRIVLKKE